MNDEINEDRISGQDRDRLHELLCRVVFGEATAEETAEVTAALGSSESLRAQKAELEATVSLVRGAYTEASADELSTGRFDAIVAAAGGNAPAETVATETGKLLGGPAWFARPAARTAAVVALLVGAGGVWWSGQPKDGSTDSEEADVARVSRTADFDERSQVIGYGGGLAATIDGGTDGPFTPSDEQTTAFGLNSGIADRGANATDDPNESLFFFDEAGKNDATLAYLDLATVSKDAPGLELDGQSPQVRYEAQAQGEAVNDLRKGLVARNEIGLDRLALVEETTAGQAGGGAGGVGAYLTSTVTPQSVGGSYRGPGDVSPPAVGVENRRGAGGGGGRLAGDQLTTLGTPGSPAALSATVARVTPASPGAGGGGGPAAPGASGPSTPGPSSPGPSSPGLAGPGSGSPALTGGASRPIGNTAQPSESLRSTEGLASKESKLPADGAALEALGYGHVAVEPEAKTRARGALAPGSEPSADDLFLGRGGGEPSGSRDEFHRFHRQITSAPTRLPNERPRDMFFRFWGDNPFVITDRDAQSTFAADVDTASFSLARRMLREGYLPPREQVRTEEFVNFAKPDLAPPTEGTFALHGELAPSPFGGSEHRWLLRVGVRAAEIDRDRRPPLALTFVVDTSGSMKENNRLELVKHAMRLLVGELDARDSIAIVRFSNDASEVLPPTSAAARDVIETALFQLQPNGSTNAEAGLKLGYSLAEQMLIEGVQTRVVLLSDGVANVGETDQARIAEDVSQLAQRGIFLNTIGVGMANHNDVFLEQMANKGQGVCDYVGDAKDARRAIVERFVGNFVTVAKDVKIQVEFDGTQVLRWRQLGYENRAVADRDFRNDAIDAGEIGAGHQVACLYELELPAGADLGDGPLATLRLRWKPVSTGEQQPLTEAVEIERKFVFGDIVATSFRAAPLGFRRAALSAQLAECLRRSTHARGDSMTTLGKELAQLLSEDRVEDTATIADMTKRSIDLGLERYLAAPIAGDPDAAHRQAYYDALIQSLGGAEKGPGVGSEDGGEPRTYESRIRDLLERDRSGQGH